jgi:protein-L-isoaspartate(D-aspartate) O-methyltransferase
MEVEEKRADDGPFTLLREGMVRMQIERRGVSDPATLSAMRAVPRHEFVPEQFRHAAYEDYPLPIGLEQTISQPYIVALMTEALMPGPGDRVLEIGTGSGYQAAVLAEIVGEVYSIEILCELEERARRDLDRLGYTAVKTKCGDGYQGWPEHAPFDAVIVTAAPDHIPQPLVEQLKVGGRIVIPVGSRSQELIRLTKTEDGVERERLAGVRFVPMTGEAEEK